MNIHCPNCETDLSASVEAVLPDETDLTISLTITPGQLVLATTLAGVLENFAGMQVEVGRAMGCETNVFVAGLSYENDVISVTTRIVNAPRDSDASLAEDPSGAEPRSGGSAGRNGIAHPLPEEPSHD